MLNANAEGDFEAAFTILTEKRASALVVSDDALFTNRRAALAALAARHAVPAIYGRREFVAAGGLMSYGASTLDQYYQSGVYIGRIHKGAKPDSQGREASRSAIPAADQVRFRYQS